MFLIAGLGNPGSEYSGTRHNAGFMAAERFIERHGLGRPKRRYQGRWIEGRFAGRPVAVLMPQTFMNNSGASVLEASDRKHIPPQQIIVVHDDMDFPLGVVRTRSGGGSGGHKGLESITSLLGTPDYIRVRIGIGRPDGFEGEASDWVLAPFDAAEGRLDQVLEEAVDCLDMVIRNGVEAAMNRFNRRDDGEE